MKLTPNSRLWSVLTWYLVRSKTYRSLSPGVKSLYKTMIVRLQRDHKELLWSTHYSCPGGEAEYILDHYTYGGQPSHAGNMLDVFKSAFRAAVKEEGLDCNPVEHLLFPNLPKLKSQVDNLIPFVDAAFTKFEWRNAGIFLLLIYCVPMIYSRALVLEWSSVDPLLLDIDMAGRRYEVPEPLFSLLMEHKGDWDFQRYVLPKEANVPYLMGDMYNLCLQIAHTNDIKIPQSHHLFKEGLNEWNQRCLSTLQD